MNVGQFTLPVLFARHGWFAIILIALGSMLCAHTALLMTESLVQLLGFVGSGEVNDVQHGLIRTFHIKIFLRHVPGFTCFVGMDPDGMMKSDPEGPSRIRSFEKYFEKFSFCWEFTCQRVFCWGGGFSRVTQSSGYLTMSSHFFNLHFWKVDATWSSNTRLFGARSSSSRSTICSSITSLGDD